ncbi:MAG: hypothetical protein WDN04_02045 [Rhodospirillales bacterium]
MTVDTGAVLSGAGAVNPLGAIDDFGTITASGGTLLLGDIAGSGMLDIGVGATMVLEGTADASLTVDFAGPGTLAVIGALPSAYIGGFGDGDAILLPMGVTSTAYGATAPNTGVLTLFDNGEVVGELTLLGVGQGQSFTVTADGNGTMLTTTTDNWGGGGSIVRNPTTGSGSGQFGVITGFSFFELLSQPIQLALESVVNGLTSYVWTSPDGTYFGPWQPGYSNIAVVAAPVALTKIVLPTAYVALLAQGNAPVTLTDGGAGGAVIVGNAGRDTIVGFGANDTLAGGAGGNTVFLRQLRCRHLWLRQRQHRDRPGVIALSARQPRAAAWRSSARRRTGLRSAATTPLSAHPATAPTTRSMRPAPTPCSRLRWANWCITAVLAATWWSAPAARSKCSAGPATAACCGAAMRPGRISMAGRGRPKSPAAAAG